MCKLELQKRLFSAPWSNTLALLNLPQRHDSWKLRGLSMTAGQRDVEPDDLSASVDNTL